MASQPSGNSEPSQRIAVKLESHLSGKRVKIRVEHFESQLGWYQAGALTLPIHQLPLLEQALADLRGAAAEEESLAAKIIPFPGLPQPGGPAGQEVARNAAATTLVS